MIPPREFQELAEFHGVQLSYYDVRGQRRDASVESLLRVLQCLGVPIERCEQARDLLREGQSAQARRVMEPVHVCWQGEPPAVVFRLPAGGRAAAVSCRVTTEQGATHAWSVPLDEIPAVASRHVEGVTYVDRRLPIPVSLPDGYHELQLEADGRVHTSLLLAAPRTAFSLTGDRPRRWGVFLPLYALHTSRSWGAGDFADLVALNDWVAGLGGSLVASLPMLASFHEQEGDESPYRPVSRMFWNELFLDPSRVPGGVGSAEAPPELAPAIGDLRGRPLVEYRRQMALKRHYLEPLARRFLEDPRPRDTFDEFLRRHPEVEAYARFRAVDERHGRPWTQWPVPLRDGAIAPGDYDEGAFRYHLFVQWLLEEQLSQIVGQARARGLTWYLDLPLGVHPDGFDVWRYRHVFALDASGGAPPDAFFTQGQCWGFPPFHPQRLREQGYRYLISVLWAHLRYAGVLRIDHVMGLHRLFWVPTDMQAQDGVYVRYPADEYYAILTIESRRHEARIIGENLGTVPPEVNVAMDEHAIGRLYVLQYFVNDWDANRDRPAAEISSNHVASLNTHDMPPFAAYWRGLDTDDRLALGLMSPFEADAERRLRDGTRKRLVDFLRRCGFLCSHAETIFDIMQACLAYLSQSPAEVVLVNLEDLWLETWPQNTPGTTTERINWRRKAKRPLEEMIGDPQIRQVLQRVDAFRQRA